MIDFFILVPQVYAIDENQILAGICTAGALICVQKSHASGKQAITCRQFSDKLYEYYKCGDLYHSQVALDIIRDARAYKSRSEDLLKDQKAYQSLSIILLITGTLCFFLLQEDSRFSMRTSIQGSKVLACTTIKF